jgi:hypothetical protein
MSPLPFANPFGALVGRPLDDDQPDVAEINIDAFKACQRLVQDVAAGGFSAALTVFGDAGTGKTHLIGRVRRWLEQQPQHLFVFVRMETSPAGIWRHLRRHLAIALLRPNAAGARAIDTLLNNRLNDFDVERDLAVVFENLLLGRHVRDSAAWLRGEGLPEETLRPLQLTNPGPDDDPEAVSRRVVLSICELLRPGVVVFCMDQIEAIMSSASDKDGPHAFARAVACLVDETRNASIICCEQSAFINTLEQILDNAAKNRVMGRRTPILPLSWEQAQQLIKSRLRSLPESEIANFWLKAKDRFKDIFTDNAAPARKVISRCKDLFDQSTETAPAEKSLQGMLDQRVSRKAPADTEAVLRNSIPLLARSAKLTQSTAGNRSPLDFLINDGKVAVVIINQANGLSLANHVRKISEAWKPEPNQKLLLLRDARLPIPRNAKRTKERLADLEKQGGHVVTVSQEAVEALAALRRLLSDAESGDLAHHGEPITPRDVEQWIAGNLPAALDQLISEFGTASTDDLTPRLAALLAESKIVRLEDAARSLEVTPGRIEECARRDPRQFGFLGGSVPALFQPVTAPDVSYRG